MNAIKKSFNLKPALAAKLDRIIEQNPGFRCPYTEEDVDEFMSNNHELMDKLSKGGGTRLVFL